jgi:hypothetical protein
MKLTLPSLAFHGYMLSFLGQASASHRRLTIDSSIADAISSEIVNGAHPKFTLTASYGGGNNLFTEEEPFEMNVTLTSPSVTSDTSYSGMGGLSKAVTPSSIRYLVADGDNTDVFALLAVDMETGTVRGLAQKDHKLVSVAQDVGSDVVANDVESTSKDWNCELAQLKLEDVEEQHGRRLGEDHEHHQHASHHHTTNIMDNLKDLATQLGVGAHFQNQRRTTYQTDTFPSKWSYQVDLYIEVDTDMVNARDPEDTENMPNTIEYINALFTAINSIYEREIDTHLHILHIAHTNIYDNAGSPTQALGIMANTYGSTEWHYTDPNTGYTPDLHHLIMHKNLYGGVAYTLSDENGETVGVLCMPSVGFGVSTNCQGSMEQIESDAFFWDLIVVAHEIGHNFGTSHTHETADYKPLIDRCGQDPNVCTGVTDEAQVSNGDATIMSYCHLCPGGTGNMAATFGGYWAGGDRSNLDNWMNTEGVEWSNNPKRVSQKLYASVSSQGSCVAPYLDVPSQFCDAENPVESCDDLDECTTDMCNSDTLLCSNVIVPNCCGNGICEPGESPECTADCSLSL